MIRAALVSLLLLAAFPARADFNRAPAVSASLTTGALATQRSTVRGSFADAYSLITAHFEAGVAIGSAGALVALGNLSVPLTQNPIGAILTAGGGLRFGPEEARLTFGAGATTWTVSGTQLTGPSVLLHLAVPIAGRLALHAQGEGHLVGSLTGYALSAGIGFNE